MAYANISQVLALSKTASDAGLEIDPFPKLGGKLEKIDPDGVREFNASVEQWVTKLMAAIEKSISESVPET